MILRYRSSKREECCFSDSAVITCDYDQDIDEGDVVHPGVLYAHAVGGDVANLRLAQAFARSGSDGGDQSTQSEHRVR